MGPAGMVELALKDGQALPLSGIKEPNEKAAHHLQVS